MKLRGNDAGVKAVQEAEFAVLSSIAVREQHKEKLRALLSIINPQARPGTRPQERIHVRTKKGQPKKIKPEKGFQLAEGKEIHVLGDLLLLTRAASVDVVENIQVWREVVHGGVPRPYIYDNENYLLSMCEDLDFLDQAGDVVEWLGFRLVRNPFIITEALDDVMSRRLGISVHETRSLKYWRSASWRQNNKLDSQQHGFPDSKSRQSTHDRWQKYPPPRPLVVPLASIGPEDDVVDGLRITAAQSTLLEEEGYHGRLRALRITEEYVERGPSTFGSGDVGNNVGGTSVYDAIAAVDSKLKEVESHSSLLRREHAQVERTLQDLNNQVKWTELCRDSDRTKDRRVWQYHDKFRQEALKTYAKLAERLQHCLTVLSYGNGRFRRVLDTYKYRMHELRLEKDKQRAARLDMKKEEEAARRRAINKTAQKRGSKLRAKKLNPKKHLDTETEVSKESSEPRDSAAYEDTAKDIQRDIRVLVGRKPDRNTAPEFPEVDHRQLELKRQKAVYRKRAHLEQQARIAKEKDIMLERRRAENVAMKWEDALSRIVEREARRKIRLRARKEMMDRVASCAIFKCTHEMNRKRFLISVYTRNAHGYELEGLRIVAYDPNSCAAFTMIMALREFNSFGYGRTSEGLGAFCKWLCLLYEKRQRQFRLVWSGGPCPPPLRVRENDQALVCIHKEGIKMHQVSSDGYAFVAVYLRTDNPSIARFVIGASHGHGFLLSERAVEARSLITSSDLDAQWKSSECPTIVWKHNADAFKREESNLSMTSTSAIGIRVYSSDTIVNRVRYSVHIYDTNESDFTVELISKPKKDKYAHGAIPSSASNRVILLKRKVNPYDVHLSSSNFADLLSLTRFEQTPSRNLISNGAETDDRDGFGWKATVSPKWAGKLANYVRVFRLAKYASKVGGVFCFVTVFVVQQKTEFRAHLLLEVTWLASTLSSSCSLGGVDTRQSLRIPLSEYLRCVNVSRRLTLGVGYGHSASEGGDKCTACLAYTATRARFYDSAASSTPETAFEYSSSCSTCSMIQYRRLHAIRELLNYAAATAPESLEFIYHAYCEVCTRLAPPIVLVLGSVFSGTTMWMLPVLSHYFSCFDCNNYGLCKFVDGDQEHTVSEEGVHVRDTFLHTLARDQVSVLFNADCGVTVASANLFVNDLHWWLYPDCSELPCHVAYIVPGKENGFEHIPEKLQRDFDLVEALQALNHAACQVAELTPVHLDDAGDGATDHASAFDAYLVAEAVLVEATRVLLHPDYAWQKPRKIVGAPSWSTACSFLLGPVQLSAALQRFDPLYLNPATAEVLEAYFTHEKWPHDYPNVRPFFYGILAFMTHVQRVRQILVLRSGALQISSAPKHATDGENTSNHETLAKNTSVLDCSLQSNSTKVLGSLTL